MSRTFIIYQIITEIILGFQFIITLNPSATFFNVEIWLLKWIVDVQGLAQISESYRFILMILLLIFTFTIFLCCYESERFKKYVRG